MAESIKEFRTWLIGILTAIIIGAGGYTLAAQSEAISKHAERIAKLEAIAEAQREINRELKEIVRELSTR